MSATPPIPHIPSAAELRSDIRDKLTAALARVAALEETNRGLASLIDELRIQANANDADRERLDWLEKRESALNFWRMDDPSGEPLRPIWQVEEYSLTLARCSAREALDAAMQSDAARGSEAKS